MKKLILLVLAFAGSLVTYATTFTVSNSPSTIGQFNTIQDAINVCANGDTVYVYGSPNVYGAFTILDKKVAVIGPGWAPDKNLGLQAIVNGCFIRNSPAGGSPDGSELQGLVFNGQIHPSHAVASDFGTSDIRIIRCRFDNAVNFGLSANNLLIEGCIFFNVINFSASHTYQNVLFQNNILSVPKRCLL